MVELQIILLLHDPNKKMAQKVVDDRLLLPTIKIPLNPNYNNMCFSHHGGWVCACMCA